MGNLKPQAVGQSEIGKRLSLAALERRNMAAGVSKTA
jgi:hypothetical protein